jgi:hypothetical protein
VEAALAVAALVAIAMLCVGGLAAISAQVRCLDAAREAARLTARGADQSVDLAVQNIAPRGAVLRIRRDGEFVVATVAVDAALLPGITISADAVAVVEPGA